MVLMTKHNNCGESLIPTGRKSKAWWLRRLIDIILIS